MRIKYLFVFGLLALLVAACGPQMVTPTAQEATVSTAEPTTVQAGEVESPTTAADVPTPAAEDSITMTLPITSTGGVEVALEAIEPVEGALATVNGEEITWADYEPELLQALYSVTQQYGVDWNQAENVALLAQFQDDILQTVIDRTLLRQLAAEEGIEVSQADLEASIEEQKQAILESGYDTWEQFLEEAGLTDEYFTRLMEDGELVDLISEAHAPDREAEQVHARHILVADEETAQEVLDKLDAGEEWGTLAAEYSQDTSNKDSEGDLGWFPRGMMVTEFEDAVFALEPGETSGPVETDYGVHIIQVLEKGMHELDETTYQSLVNQAFETWLTEGRAASDTSVLVTFAPQE